MITAAQGFTVFFCFLEGVEISNEGLPAYFSNMWNVMDWLNFCLFGLVWWYLLTMLYQDKNPSCAPLCESIGYQDDWEVCLLSEVSLPPKASLW